MADVSRRDATALLLSVLAGAAGAQEAPPALIIDWATGLGSRGRFYVVTAIDGKDVRNAIDASRSRSYGLGPRMVAVGSSRSVPAGRVKLSLRGTIVDAAPVESIFRAVFGEGQPDVTGTAEYDLEPGKTYRVNGRVDDFRREVWLEDSDGRILGQKFVRAADAERLKAMEGAPYVTTNLRYSGDWISDDPPLDLPFVPIGSRLKVVSTSTGRASVLIDGRKMRVGVDYGYKQENAAQFVARITSAEDPLPRLAALPPQVREAIESGRVRAGMTRDQVVMALGRPRLDLVPTLDAGDWTYHLESGQSATARFDAEGRLEALDGPDEVRAAVWMAPPAPPAAADAASAAASAAVPAEAPAPTASGAAAPEAASAPR